MADNFIDRLTYMACQAAKHRNSSKVEIKDFQLELGNLWSIYIRTAVEFVHTRFLR
jgi:transcription initiation factor TFIID subunit TAF12